MKIDMKKLAETLKKIDRAYHAEAVKAMVKNMDKQIVENRARPVK